MLKTVVIAYFCVLLLVSLIAFALYGKDKKIAGAGPARIRESTLLGVAAFGGALGALLGRTLFRHKTKKIYFSVVIYLSVILQIGVGALLLLLCGGVI